MMRERQDALEAFHSAKQRVNEINSLALDQLNRHLGDSDAAKGAEAALARKIEDAGRKLFGSEGYKRIWEIDSLTRSEWEDLNCSGFNYEAAKALLKETAEKKGRLIPPQAGS